MSHFDEQRRTLMLEGHSSFWIECNGHDNARWDFRAGSNGQIRKHVRAKVHLDQLRWNCVPNQAFQISTESQFGLINGKRLVSLPRSPVPWAEINAGWGFASQLLFYFSKTLRFQFSRYKLIPHGSCSYLQPLGTASDSKKESSLPLFGSKEMNYDSKRRYDGAQVAFLYCLSEIDQYSRSIDRNQRLPFSILGESVGNMNIKCFGSSGDLDTSVHATRLMLINMKVMLTWVEQHSHTNPSVP